MKLIKHILLGCALFAGVRAHAATNVVLNANNSGAGSLRQTILDSMSGDTILFTNTLSGATILLTSGELLLNKNLTIDGVTTNISINGNATGRIFQVSNNTTVVLTALIITNGKTLHGGGIRNQGTLTVNRSIISGNLANEAWGGGIYNLGMLTVNQSTLSGNSSRGEGGGIYNIGTLMVNQSTFYGNSARFNGGGILHDGFGKVMTVSQSTISGNSAFGGGINIGFGTVNLTNSIVAGNSGGDIVGAFSGSNNLTNGNPLLAPLGNYGGPTPTMPPLPGSPAVDGCTNSTGFATDQRGQPRIVGAFADIGAVEGVFNPSFPLINPVVLVNGAFQFSFANLAGASFTVFASTNVALPFNAWQNLGTAVEIPTSSGQYQFTDPQATNYTERYYRMSSL